MPVRPPSLRRPALTSLLAWTVAVGIGAVAGAIAYFSTDLAQLRWAPGRIGLTVAAGLLAGAAAASQARGPLRTLVARISGQEPPGAATAPVTILHAGADRVWSAWAQGFLESRGAMAAASDVRHWRPGRPPGPVVLLAGAGFGLSPAAAAAAEQLPRTVRWLTVIPVDGCPLPAVLDAVSYRSAARPAPASPAGADRGGEGGGTGAGTRGDGGAGLLTSMPEELAGDLLLDALAALGWQPPVSPPQPPTAAGRAPSGPPAAHYPGDPAPWRIWHAVPPESPVFSGREAELHRLAAVLLGERPAGVSVPACALHGIGGAGKTELAVQFAHRFRAYYATVVWLVLSNEEAADKGRAAERTQAVVGESLAGLAAELQVRADDPAQQLDQVWAAIRARGSALIVFDNAAGEADVAPWWPKPGGDIAVLVTTHSRDWTRAEAVPVGALGKDAAVRLLLSRAHSDDTEGAGRIAEKVGCLPLALYGLAKLAFEEQRSWGSLEDLLEEKLMDAVRKAGEQAPGGAGYADLTWEVSLDRAMSRKPGCDQLMYLFAFLGPERIPRQLPVAHPDTLPPSLAGFVASDSEYSAGLAALADTALITLRPDAISVHRVVQAVMRGLLTAEQRRGWAVAAIRLVERAFPANPASDASWPDCAQLLPHALAVTGSGVGPEAAPHETADLCLRAAGYLVAVRARQEPALGLLDQALELRAASAGRESAGVAEVLVSKAQVLQNLARVQEARTTAAQAVAIWEQVSGPDSPAMLPALRALADALVETGHGPEVAEAAQVLQRALTICEAAPGAPHREAGDILALLGYVYRRLGDPAAGRDALTRALAAWNAASSPPPRGRVIALRRLGQVLQDMGDLDSALARLEEARQVGLATLGAAQVETVRAEACLGVVLGMLGRFAEAEELQRHAIDFFTTAHPAWFLREDVMKGFALTLVRAGKADEAVQVARQAVENCTAHRGADHPYNAEALFALGAALRAQGDLAAARATLERALAIYESAYGTAYPPAAPVRAELASVLDALHRPGRPGVTGPAPKASTGPAG